jgi:hypothetical protein
MTINDHLVIRGNSELTAARDGLTFRPLTVRVVLEATDDNVGRIDFGVVEPGSLSTPYSLDIQLHGQAPTGLPRVLVVGQTLSNCEDWKAVATISGNPDNLELYCQILDNADPAGTRPKMALMLVPRGYQPNTGDGARVLSPAVGGLVGNWASDRRVSGRTIAKPVRRFCHMMISALLALARCAQLPFLESYEVEGVLSREKGQHEVYLLVLFKAPTDARIASGAFTRFINAIPIPIDPFLGIVVDPTVSFNRLLYQDKAGTSGRIRFPYRQILREYVESISKGVSHEIRLRLQAILSTVNDAPHTSTVDKDQSEGEKELEHWKSIYQTKGVRRNMTQAVEDLVTLKNQERAGLIKQALAIQKQLDAVVPPLGRRLPDFAQVDPSKGEYEAQVSDDEDLGPDDKEKPRGKTGFDEEAAENDDVVGEDEAPKSLTNTKPQGDDDDENEGPTDDDLEEEKKRAGPIKAVMDKIKVGWRKVVGGITKSNDSDEDEAPKKETNNRADDSVPKKKKRKKRLVDEESDDNPNPRAEAPAPPTPKAEPEEPQPLAPVQPPPPAPEPPAPAAPASEPPAPEPPVPTPEPPAEEGAPPPAPEPPVPTPEPPAEERAVPPVSAPAAEKPGLPPAAEAPVPPPAPEPPEAPAPAAEAPAPAPAPETAEPEKPAPREEAAAPPHEPEHRAFPHRRAYGEPVSKQEQPRAEPAWSKPAKHVRRERRPIVREGSAGDAFANRASAARHEVPPAGDKAHDETTADSDKPPHRFHRGAGAEAAAERRETDREDLKKPGHRRPAGEADIDWRRARLEKLRARRAALAREATE